MPVQFGNIYQGKKILLTGHTGFKGSWLALWLTQLGAEVIGVSKDLPSEPNHFSLLKLSLTDLRGNILDQNFLTETLSTHKPDLIFHLAAQAIVRRSYNDPLTTYATNVMGTLHLFEAVRQSALQTGIVNITTDKCYENREDGEAYKETDPMGGFDPYSSSKGCSELLSASYRNSFFHPNEYEKSHTVLLATARSGNVIGGGDWAEDRLIPDIIRATAKKETTEIRNPHAVRPWQHVLEPLSGYLLLGEKLLGKEKKYASAWNFGPDSEQSKTVSQVIESAQKSWPDITVKFSENTQNPHEATLLTLDSSKAQTKLGWKNVWQYDEGMKHTIEWYKKFYSAKEVLSLKQLELFLQSAQKSEVTWLK